MTDRSDQYMQEDEVSLKEAILKVKRWSIYLRYKWRWILFIALLGSGGSFIYTLVVSPTYSATITFITDNNNNSQLSGLSSMALQFGFLGVNSPTGGLFEGDNLFNLMKTRKMLEQTLLSEVRVSGKQKRLVDLYVSSDGELRKDFGKLNFDVDTAHFNWKQAIALKNISQQIVNDLKFGNGNIKSLTCTSKDSLFPKFFVEGLLNNVSKFYTATKTKKEQENLDLLQHQMDSVKTRLYGSIGNVASFQDLNLNLVRQQPRVQEQKSSINVEINQAIYSALAQNLEAAKVAVRKETPLIEVIDYPLFPLDEKKPGILKSIFFWFFLGAFLATGWILLRGVYKEIMEDEL